MSWPLHCTINEGDPYEAVSWTCTNTPARGRGCLLRTLPTLPHSQNPCVWALFMLFPVLPLSKQGASHIHYTVVGHFLWQGSRRQWGGGVLGLRRLVTGGVSGMCGERISG